MHGGTVLQAPGTISCLRESQQTAQDVQCVFDDCGAHLYLQCEEIICCEESYLCPILTKVVNI